MGRGGDLGSRGPMALTDLRIFVSDIGLIGALLLIEVGLSLPSSTEKRVWDLGS